MATAYEYDKLTEAQKPACLEEWLGRLNALVDTVEVWAREFGWSTRRIEKPMDDPPLGRYQAPALLMQELFARVFLEPTSRFVAGADGGGANLYLMPEYDDIAQLWHDDGRWYVEHRYAGMEATLRDDVTKPFTKEAFRDILQEMNEHAAKVG
jgi:hypothetical protein